MLKKLIVKLTGWLQKPDSTKSILQELCSLLEKRAAAEKRLKTAKKCLKDEIDPQSEHFDDRHQEH